METSYFENLVTSENFTAVRKVFGKILSRKPVCC